MIREDRLLLAELSRLNTDVVPLALRIMDQSATPEEHYAFAGRLIAMAHQLQTRAAGPALVIDADPLPTNGGMAPALRTHRPPTP